MVSVGQKMMTIKQKSNIYYSYRRIFLLFVMLLRRTLWICVTTANYPDVMMPSYNESRLTALYFISFMVISFFYLMNLILAVTVNS
ncbi:MAG: hypothetical protein ACI8RD_008182 [Bacillariaceae sp.]|jgi:hypothetical protein